MNRPPSPPDQSDRGAQARPELYFEPHRPGRVDRRFLPPALILLLGAGLIAYRLAIPDWHWDLAAKPPPKSMTPTPASKSGPVATKPAAPKAVPDAVARAARDDIRREAEREKARREEIERLKEEEGRRLAAEERRDPRPMPDPRVGHLIPGDRERQFRGWADDQAEAHRRRFEAMVREQQELQRRRMEEIWGRHQAMIDQMQPRPLPGTPDARSFGFAMPPGGGFQYEMHWEFRSNGP